MINSAEFGFEKLASRQIAGVERFEDRSVLMRVNQF
jgi:hypothetical protein